MLRFTKMEGCGNDFLVVDLREGAQPETRHGDAPPDTALAARRLCDRHYGVGADGVLVLDEARAPEAAARMRIFNADGSEAEMCGNGIRCVAKYLYERDARLRHPSLPIETGAGVLACGLTVDARRHVTRVSVAMGRPRLARGEVPMVGPPAERFVEGEIATPARAFRATAVSVGNPHLVVFVDGDEDLHRLAVEHGPALEAHPWMPNRANVEFARARSAAEIDAVVWERGCGVTLACGTGACAVVVAACLTGRSRAGQDVTVHLPGGPLAIRVAEGMDGVTLTGPAREVFEAEIDLAALLHEPPPA